LIFLAKHKTADVSLRHYELLIGNAKLENEEMRPMPSSRMRRMLSVNPGLGKFVKRRERFCVGAKLFTIDE
jgi:hypothetical protein